MKRFNNKTGFTLLEIIIVIIIIGVLASLALPRMFAMTDNAKAVEAMSFFKTFRNGMDMCFMQGGSTYVGCNTWATIGVNDPNSEASRHFTFTFVSQSANTYVFRAQLFGPTNTNVLTLTVNRTVTPAVTIRGGGAFSSINISSDT